MNENIEVTLDMLVFDYVIPEAEGNSSHIREKCADIYLERYRNVILDSTNNAMKAVRDALIDTSKKLIAEFERHLSCFDSDVKDSFIISNGNSCCQKWIMGIVREIEKTA